MLKYALTERISRQQSTTVTFMYRYGGVLATRTQSVLPTASSNMVRFVALLDADTNLSSLHSDVWHRHSLSGHFERYHLFETDNASALGALRNHPCVGALHVQQRRQLMERDFLDIFNRQNAQDDNRIGDRLLPPTSGATTKATSHTTTSTPILLPINDPLYESQWHLHSEQNLNILPVWQRNLFGRGIKVAIVDDGIQYKHPDLAANFNADLSYDFNGNTDDVRPRIVNDTHGTMGAGVCCAVNNAHTRDLLRSLNAEQFREFLSVEEFLDERTRQALYETNVTGAQCLDALDAAFVATWRRPSSANASASLMTLLSSLVEALPSAFKNRHRRHESHCGVGVAPLATVVGIRLVSVMTEDWQEALAIDYRSESIDVYSNSWGPPDDGKRLDGPGALSAMALEFGVRRGRGGLGSVYVWSVGNGGKVLDNCNYDAWANSPYTLTIGSVTHDGEAPWYAERCAAMIGVTPSSGHARSVITTDLLGVEGLDDGPCTQKFRGTSASAPMAAGVVALLLEARRSLSWLDVQLVMALSANSRLYRAASEDEWQHTGADLYYHHSYGFGLLNAMRAVQLGMQWRTLGTNYTHTFDSDYVPVDQTLMPGEIYSRSFEFDDVDLARDAPPLCVYVRVYFNASLPHRGKLDIRLESPHGTFAQLAEWHNDLNPHGNHTDERNARVFADDAERRERHAPHNAFPMWPFSSLVTLGERVGGRWTLLVAVSRREGPSRQRGVWSGYRLQVFASDRLGENFHLIK